MGRQEMYQRMGVHAPFDPQHKLVTSAVFPPLVLALIRSTLACYTLVSIVFSLAWKGARLAAIKDSNAASTFSYFTELSYIGLCAYFFASSVQTWAYVVRGGKGYPLQRWPRVLQFLHLLLVSTVISFPFLVTIVYWILLSDGAFKDRYSTWSNISKHALNSVFALFEIALTRVGPNPWSHTFFLIIILAGYVGVAYITHATKGFYVYSFLNPKKQKGFLAAYIVGIPIGEVIVFSIAQGMCILRERIIIRYGCNGRTQYGPEELDEWQSVEVPSDVPMAM